VRNFSFLSLILVLSFAGCTTRQESPDQVREKTAQATAEIKQNAKAMAQGIREGWNRDKPLDLNKATKDQLTSLPGITSEKADRILENTPYDTPHQLVSRRILSEDEYSKIQDQITAKP
jgi:DNA uptake protein ComE-like DNA-binding protein